ncbi:hypothetical protein THIOM_001028 [Candidatus Thiomargarita nelsonii]|uniref:Uncharacterized protein n=1 Tax=Candidatus Thiomargarita nelsonii TaxID=1003181 RepID=A0A176S5C9_9GAMM|nr:hypothetical protein THIOM_001028 [Candidatus Thiomargarita nelsonii]
MERLKEARVQRIIEPVIIGESKGYSVLDDDHQYVLDLGLLRHAEGHLVPANPIYGEVIIRTLSSRTQMETQVTLWRENLSRRFGTIGWVYG